MVDDRVKTGHEPGPTSRRAFRTVRWFLPIFALIAIGLSVFWLSEVSLSGDVLGPLSLRALSAHGFTCAAAILFTWNLLRRGEVTATRWARAAIVWAVPWTIFTAATAALGVGVWAESLTPSTPAVVWVLFVSLFVICVTMASTLVVLVRLLFSDDLEMVLWSDLSAGLRVGLDFDEGDWVAGSDRDQEVIFDREDATASVETQSARSSST